MKRINFFNYQSALFPFRWFIVITFTIIVFLAWHNLNGGRVFTSGGQQQWSSSGPGYHK
jgi:hypothetical protein